MQAHAALLSDLWSRSLIALAGLSIACGWLIAGRALRPVRVITAAARRMSASNLGERLALTGPRDELKELGDTFDQLLARLQASFRAQRQFIANAAHEMPTPLARQQVISQVALAEPAASAESLRTSGWRLGTAAHHCPFQQITGESTSHGDGLSLGLSIVAAIAEAHRASIAATPLPEDGLLIKVTFPDLGNPGPAEVPS